MRNAHLPLLIALAALLPACKREAPVAADAPSTTVAAPAATDAVSPEVMAVDDRASPADAAPGFDVKAVAGTYAGTIPCADCPGIDTRLVLEPGGRYTLHQSYRERDARFDETGTWSAKPGGKAILLDPDAKGDADASLQIIAADELRFLGAEDAPNGPLYALKRTP